MNTVAFPMETSTALAAQAIEGFTQNTFGLRFPSDEGYYQLFRGHSVPHAWDDHVGPISVVLYCQYCFDDLERDVMVTERMQEAMRFDIKQKRKEEAKVIATCFVPAVEPFFQAILRAIGSDWPESGLLSQEPAHIVALRAWLDAPERDKRGADKLAKLAFVYTHANSGLSYEDFYYRTNKKRETIVGYYREIEAAMNSTQFKRWMQLPTDIVSTLPLKQLNLIDLLEEAA